jgi:hypothetical protein
MTPYQGRFSVGSKASSNEYDCNIGKMVEYLAEVRRMEKFFDGFEVWYVPRLDNRDVDNLAWIVSSKASTSSNVIIEKLTKPSVRLAEESINAAKPDLMVIDEPELG